MDIKTFAVFPDSKFKYGCVVYIGSINMGLTELKEFVSTDSFAKYAKNKKMRKCFDYANGLTSTNITKKQKVYLAMYRFYPPFLWSRKKIIKVLQESFDYCVIDGVEESGEKS